MSGFSPVITAYHAFMSSSANAESSGMEENSVIRETFFGFMSGVWLDIERTESVTRNKEGKKSGKAVS